MSESHEAVCYEQMVQCKPEEGQALTEEDHGVLYMGVQS